MREGGREGVRERGREGREGEGRQNKFVVCSYKFRAKVSTFSSI